MSGLTDPLSATFWGKLSYATLKFAADRLKVPVEELAAEVLLRDRENSAERQARLKDETSSERAEELERILALLASHRDSSSEDVAAFARAEVTEDDPLRAQRVTAEDVHGVGAAFGHRLERRSP